MYIQNRRASGLPALGAFAALALLWATPSWAGPGDPFNGIDVSLIDKSTGSAGLMLPIADAPVTGNIGPGVYGPSAELVFPPGIIVGGGLGSTSNDIEDDQFIAAFEYTITNSTGTMILGGDPNGGYGGSMALGGTWRALTASGATLFTLPLSAIGVNGTATVAHAYGGNVTIFGTGWGTAPATLTGIDTAFGGSATVSVQATGSDLRTPGGLGAIQFVTPVKIVTPFGAMGMILGLDVMVVPEPGGACLIGAGLVGLLGLRRSRDRGPAPR